MMTEFSFVWLSVFNPSHQKEKECHSRPEVLFTFLLNINKTNIFCVLTCKDELVRQVMCPDKVNRVFFFI